MPDPCRLCGDTEFIRSVWQRYDALPTDSSTGNNSGTRVFTNFVATLQRLVTSHPSVVTRRLCKCKAWVCPRVTRCLVRIVTVSTASRTWSVSIGDSRCGARPGGLGRLRHISIGARRRPEDHRKPKITETERPLCQFESKWHVRRDTKA